MYPKRIVALSAEITEIIYELGAQKQLVGISGYSTYPSKAREEKTIIAAFQDVSIDKVKELNPDLVLGFSDVQAPYIAELGKLGYPVVLFNQRSIAEIYQVILQIGGLTGHVTAAEQLVHRLQKKLESIKACAAKLPRRPKVYFEEWYSPMVTGIGWVSELIELGGAEDVFKDRSASKAAQGRIVHGAEVVQRNPELILASWCGKRFISSRLIARPGWDQIYAVKNNNIHEIVSRDILAPGVAALERGLPKIFNLIRSTVGAF